MLVGGVGGGGEARTAIINSLKLMEIQEKKTTQI
jgi:hypothetical protein